eukprot:gene5641-7787_t
MDETFLKVSTSEEIDNISNTSSYLVICNISKRRNIHTLCQTATAFNMNILLVGMKNTEALYLSSEVMQKVTLLENLNELKIFLSLNSIPLYGIEISNDSISVLDKPFTRPIAFMPGNEGMGLSSRQKEIIDNSIFVPQYGCGTASLNVYVATTIVMYHYNSWLQEQT